MTLKNLTSPAGTSWVQDLEEIDGLENALPLNYFSIINNGDIVADVYLDQERVGKVQRNSAGLYIGYPFSSFEVKNPDGESFSAEDLLATVGKDIQTSELPYNPQLETIEENFERYLSGCDGRVTYETSTPAVFLPWWLNIHSALLIVRSMNFSGSASMGSYAITIGPSTTISGAVPVNGVALDQKRYKKINSTGVFGITLTNCTLSGMIVDFAKKADVLDDATYQTDNAELHDDALTSSKEFHTGNPGIALECTFTSRSIASAHIAFVYTTATALRTIMYLKVAGVWTEIINFLASANGNHYYNVTTGWADVTGCKIEYYSDNSSEKVKIYEVHLTEA